MKLVYEGYYTQDEVNQAYDHLVQNGYSFSDVTNYDNEINNNPRNNYGDSIRAIKKTRRAFSDKFGISMKDAALILIDRFSVDPRVFNLEKLNESKKRMNESFNPDLTIYDYFKNFAIENDDDFDEDAGINIYIKPVYGYKPGEYRVLYEGVNTLMGNDERVVTIGDLLYSFKQFFSE